MLESPFVIVDEKGHEFKANYILDYKDYLVYEGYNFKNKLKIFLIKDNFYVFGIGIDMNSIVIDAERKFDKDKKKLSLYKVENGQRVKI